MFYPTVCVGGNPWLCVLIFGPDSDCQFFQHGRKFVLSHSLFLMQYNAISKENIQYVCKLFTNECSEVKVSIAYPFAGPVFTKILRIFLRITHKSKKNSKNSKNRSKRKCMQFFLD